MILLFDFTFSQMKHFNIPSMKKIKLAILLVLIGMQSTLYAQLKIDAVIRPRFEFRHGYSTLAADSSEAAKFINQRTRLNFTYTQDKLITRIAIYDYRVWGDQALKKDVPGIGLYEAWAEYRFSDVYAIRFGRQAIAYDNSRLISKVNWNQNGASHDMLLLKFRKKGWISDLGLAYNQAETPKTGTDYSAMGANYKSLIYLWLNKNFGKLNLAFLAINDGHQKAGTTNTLYLRQTEGLIAKYNTDQFFLVGRYFYQSGKLQSGQDVSAFFAHTVVEVKMSNALKVHGGCEIKSGNSYDQQGNTDHAFDILIGGRHKFNGFMDYFNVPSTTAGAGLIDSYLGLSVLFEGNNSLSLDWHYFNLYGKLLFDGVEADPLLGNEFDLKWKKRVNETLQLEAAYCIMLPGKSLSKIRGIPQGELNNWAYCMITVTPKFL